MTFSRGETDKLQKSRGNFLGFNIRASKDFITFYPYEFCALGLVFHENRPLQ